MSASYKHNPLPTRAILFGAISLSRQILGIWTKAPPRISNRGIA